MPSKLPRRPSTVTRSPYPGSFPWRALATTGLGLLTAACGDPATVGLHVERDTIGDTVVVRTVSGSQWGAPAALEAEVRIGVFEGEDHYMFGQVQAIAVSPDGAVYAMDAQVPALRKYDATGQYEGTFGREGAGPGEYRQPDGGLVVLPDGRVALRDPANARIQLFSPTGEPDLTIPVRGSFRTSNNMVVDTAGLIYTQILLDPEADVTEWRSGLVAYDPDSGDARDTVAAPEWDYEEPRLVAQSADGNSTSVNGVPFSPGGDWAFSPLGYMVAGFSSRYAIDQYHPDGRVTRIERVQEPVPVDPEERADREAQTRWNMRQTQSDWTWNGPAIPDHKPAFRGIFTGQEGRIWVLVHQPAVPIPEDQLLEASATDGPNPRPVSRWREPIAFDVFETDGTYLGLVRAPEGFSLYPTPVFRGDQVWAIVRDELDVQYLTRFRVAHPPPPEA